MPGPGHPSGNPPAPPAGGPRAQRPGPVRAAVPVRGYAHRYDGTPRQDDLAVAAHPATRAVVFAVADGVSAAEHSHIGATVACRAAVDSALDQLDRGSEGINWQQLVNGVAWQLVE